MAKRKSISDLLRESLSEAPSMREVARETGLDVGSLSRFMRGEQSLRLDLADKLAEYFEIECRRTTRQRKG